MKEHMHDSGGPHRAEILGACSTGHRTQDSGPSINTHPKNTPSWVWLHGLVSCALTTPQPTYRAEKDPAVWLMLRCHCLEMEDGGCQNNFFKKRSPHFHFVLGFTNEVADLPEACLARDLLLPHYALPLPSVLELSTSLPDCRTLGIPRFWSLLFNSSSAKPTF